MNEEKILNAIGLVGDDLIIRADGPIPAASFGKSWLRWGTLAACVCLLIGAARLVLPAFSGAQSAAPAAAEAPAAMMDMEAKMEESAPALTEEAPAEEASDETEKSEKQAFEEPKAEAAIEDEVIREPITVLGRNYEEILHTDPDYTPAELTEEDLEFYLERSNGDRVYVLTWTETPAGVESWPYTIAVFRDGSLPVQYRYIGEQVYYDSLPENMRINSGSFRRVPIDDSLAFFAAYPEESLGKPWQVLAGNSRLYALGALSELISTWPELTQATNQTDMTALDTLAILYADDMIAAAYVLTGPIIACHGQLYTEVPADDPILSVFSAEAEQQQADGTQPESPWVSPWCTLSDGSRVDVLSKSVATVGDMVFPEYVIRNFDYGHSVIYRFSES